MREFDLGAVTAYALAVKNGFKGTEQEWLTSLVPNLSIGEVKTLDTGSNAAAVMGGTPENPVLNLSLPCGENGHAADWNQNDPAQPDYVKNRTHYEENGAIVPLPAKYLPVSVPYIEDGDMVEILPEYTIANEEDMAGFPALGLVEGNTYIVAANGVEYTCVAWTMTQDGVTAVGLGDLYTFSDGQAGTAATGEPFVLMDLPPEAAEGIGMNVLIQPLADEMSMPITLSIKGDVTTIHKLDNRCLDLAWIPIYSVSADPAVEILPEMTVSFSNNFKPYDGVNIQIDLVVGEKYVVYWDGISYECVAKEYPVDSGLSAVSLGDSTIQLGQSSDNGVGEPFCVVVIYQDGISVALHVYKETIGGSNTLCIMGFGKEPNKLPEAFLPDSMGSIILRSSTAGSTKRFKLAVDDTGTITAREVTD